MAKVDLKEVEKQAEQEKASAKSSGVETKEVGGKTYYKGPSLADWFDDYGDCLMANTEAKRQADYKAQGLDEFGRSPEQVLLGKKKAELFLKKASLLKEVAAIDLEIASLKVQKVEKKEEKKARK